MSPLLFRCSGCKARAVLCECCELPLDAASEVQGVLLCRRCGFLTVANAQFRALVQLTPFDRSVLQRIVFAIDWDGRQLADSMELVVMRAGQAQAGYEHICAPWTALMNEAAPMSRWFTSTHFDILRVMYEKTMDKSEFQCVCSTIEQFLLHQSTLLQAKSEVLRALKEYQRVADLPLTQDESFLNASTSRAYRIVRKCTQTKLQHQMVSFQALAHPFLSLIGTANKQLFGLYTAAHSLDKMQAHQRQEGSTRGDLSTPPQAPKRRRMGGDGLYRGKPSLTEMHQSLEYRNRLGEIAKKVDLWRTLSATIAHACMLKLTDVISIEQLGDSQ